MGNDYIGCDNMKLSTIENLKKRKSFYNLDRNVKVSDDEIIEFVKNAFYYTPSPFNAQNSKGVILLGENHDYFWGHIVMDTLRKKVNNDEKFKRTETKINSFKNAYGTVLIFEDMEIISNLQEKFPTYHDQFLEWADHSSGMVTMNLWVGFTEMGLGANIQHYNPIIDDEVKARWNIPESWKLKSQMVFGNIFEDAPSKKKVDINERVLVER